MKLAVSRTASAIQRLRAAGAGAGTAASGAAGTVVGMGVLQGSGAEEREGDASAAGRWPAGASRSVFDTRGDIGQSRSYWERHHRSHE
ncbi:hypothetical protein Sgleb_24790 [Streptomyces glebosus]|uniref:Uncharacterized protein n=1 Tax=Streptomyces glebosus TaxID=249580 RepID=A0A640SU81_9ACTN|nr:hypothetical protein Sgleb_24790 [Streptomyces glebosus]GHG55461.1 hypothetical protein GCM10010513_17620 [Streptomyces glebosus]